MNTKHLKARILDLALQGKLVENSRIPNDLNSRIPTDFNPPFEIPNSWAWVKLGDICEIISGTSYNKQDIKPQGIRILRGGNINDDTSNIDLFNDDIFIDEKLYNEKTIPQKHDILIVSSTGSEKVIGKPAFAKENFKNTQIGAFLRIIRINNNFSKYIHNIFLSEFYRKHIRSLIKGTNIYNIKNSYLENFYIPLPPKDEQERIVKKIDELFNQIDILETSKQNLLKNIKHTKARILDLALQGKLVENSRIPTDLNSRIPSDFNPPFEIPNSWQWVKLRDICEITSSKRILKSEYVKSGIPFYRTKEIVELSNKEKISTEFFISENRYNEIKSKFGIPQTNDLLISAVGTIGKIWLVDTNKPFYFKDGNLIWLKNSNSFNSLFLKYMLENQISKNKFSGTAYNALTIIFLKNLYIPLPPKDKQERIVKKIDELFEILEVIENSL